MTQAHPPAWQRRLLMTGGGVGAGALAGGAFVLSFDSLRALAVQGGANRDHAYLFPGMLDGLVVVVILSILMSRRLRWWSRAVRWLVLLVLVAGAGAAGVDRAVRGYGNLPRPWLSGGVAAAPWVLLTIALWLWISMIKQARATREGPPPEPTADTELIPGMAELPPPPAVPELEPAEPVARTLLPTDVPLVGGPSPAGTRPDGINPADTRPDGINPAETRPDGIPVPPDKAEDDDPAGPPSGTFRSSPTPPRQD